MRSANDLEIITPLVWRELTNLGIPFIRCGVFIVDGKKETVEVHLSSPGGKPLAAMHLAFDANDLTLHAVEAWKKNAVHVQQWSKTDFINYGKQMVAQGQVKDLQSYQGDAAAPESLYLHFIPFSQGLLYVGSLQPLLSEAIQLVALLAKSFAIAYARYEDFIKLEQAKAEVESAMSELKATQSQLVQQEKLASLGQLTAGIAHEIKNPLNFVNNFTEISIELIEEAIAEIQKQDDDKDTSLIDHNLDDIKANLKKVYEHGTRANSIVNSMLMHSRGGGSTPQPTLLNDFIREYSNLAFHGMRAGKDPLDVQMLFQWDESIREVPLIVEDFSRVVLNICNNAFDAMREKKKYDVGEDDTVKYKPTLSIKTTLENGKVRIQFEDNGPGIHDAIRDKILQPFFTTKKGTEGTGLGLSISHDIVKAHGGAIQVETKEGEGSVFIIILPDNNN
jgi:signal transduction histidine kinase